MTAPGPAPTLYSRDFGTGARRVLALHCTIAHSGAWRRVAAELGDGVRLTCPDMLSHGRSPDWDGQGDFQDRVVEGVLPLWDGRMDLVGHSFGALVAMRLADAFPDRVRSLTLIEPVLFAVAARDAPEVLEAHNRDAAPFSEALAAGDNALAARLFNRMWSDGGPRWPQLSESTRAAMTRGVPVVRACDGPVMHDRPGLLKPGRLDRLDMPVLLLRGARTHPVIGVVNDGLARRIPGAKNIMIDGAGHMLPITHPEPTATAIAALFDRAPA